MSTKNNNVLIVDDEESVLSTLKRVFHKSEFALETCTSPIKALDLLKTKAFATVISDQRMPEMEGTKFLAECQKLYPEMTRIMLTGFADQESAIAAINHGAIYLYLNKPWNNDDLILKVRQAVEQFNLKKENAALFAETKAANAKLTELNSSLSDKVKERTKEVENLNRKLQLELVRSIRVSTTLIDTYSQELGAHSRRVAVLTKKIASTFQFTPNELLQLEIAALLHDFGKLSMKREHIDKEYEDLGFEVKEVWEKHAGLSAKFAKEVFGEDSKITEAILHHHEHFDGSGRPRRLRGENIPLFSRIIAIADGFDNLLYRSKDANRSEQDTLALINDEATTKYDPDLIEKLATALALDHAAVDEIGIGQLRPGMEIMRDICTPDGALLLAKGTVATSGTAYTIEKHLGSRLVGGGIFVRRRRSEVKPDEASPDATGADKAKVKPNKLAKDSAQSKTEAKSAATKPGSDAKDPKATKDSKAPKSNAA